MGQDGDLVQQGDVVRTGSDSHAVLTFFDGSIIEVEPDSELIIQTLQASAAGDIVMSMQQNLGRSWHVVSHALSANSKYEVRTPTTTASVRGTAFLVTVEPNGKTNLQTTEGLVHAVAGGEEVQIPPGFETNVQPGTPPDAPTPAPPAAAVVQVIVDATPNATVTDANNRTVGVLNGLPVRYAPLSTTQVKDGKLVITYPNPTLGRIDTHVQPADGKRTDVEVNVQVQIGGEIVGNVLERRTIDTSGVAKGGVVITTTGTFVLPDSEANKAADPRIGKVPPPPAGGLTVPFIETKTAAPTPIVSVPPDFVPRFGFDPRVVAPATSTPPPPSATPTSTFNGGFQPFVIETRTAVPTDVSTPTPAPNLGMTIFTSLGTIPADLRRLTAATATPQPTLDTRLTTPILIVAPTATPDATAILRTLPPGLQLATPTAAATRFIGPLPSSVFTTPAPLLPPTLRSLPPLFSLPPAPIDSAPPSFAPFPALRSGLPIFSAPPTDTPPSDAPSSFAPLPPIRSFIPLPIFSPPPIDSAPPLPPVRPIIPLPIVSAPPVSAPPADTTPPAIRSISPIVPLPIISALPIFSAPPTDAPAPLLRSIAPIVPFVPPPTAAPLEPTAPPIVPRLPIFIPTSAPTPAPPPPPTEPPSRILVPQRSFGIFGPRG
jgi:hypothetical protein